MRAEIKPKFHNRFDIVVTNVETGEVELRGQAENMVLNRSIPDLWLLAVT